MANPSGSWCARRPRHLHDTSDCFDAKQHKNTWSSCKQEADVRKGNPRRSSQSQRNELDLSETCSRILIQHLENKDEESARKHLDVCFKELKKTSHKAFVHSVIHCCAKAGCVSTALWCALQMSSFGLSPNVITFNSVIDACAKKGDIDMANQIWELMTNSGLKPNVITYNTMINACARGNNACLAEKWLMKMLEAGLVPSTVTYSTVIAAFSRMCKPEKAEAWFAKMLEAEVKPDRILYNTIFYAFAKSGQAAKAEQWLLEMQGRGFVSDQKHFSTIIHACAKCGDWNRLEFWLRMMDHQGFVLEKNSLDYVTQQCAKGGVLGMLGRSAEPTLARAQPNLCKPMVPAAQTNEYPTNGHCLAYTMKNTGSLRPMLNAFQQGACNHHERFGSRSPEVPADKFNLPLCVALREQLPPSPECPPLPARLLGSFSALTGSPELQKHREPQSAFSL